MSQLSKDMGNLAPGHKLSHRGRVYEFRHLGLAELSEFERENYRLKRERLLADREELEADFGAGACERMRRELRERYDRSELTMQADAHFLGTGQGLALALRLMMPGATEAEIAGLFRERMADVVEIIKLVQRESLGEDAPAPNPPAAGKPG